MKSSSSAWRAQGRALALALRAAICLAGGLFLCWNHPVAPLACLVAFIVVAVANARWSGLWLVLVPACLPWFNFSPWTGWLMVEEFDLLLLAVFAGSYGRLAWVDRARGEPADAAGIAASRADAAPRDRVLFWLVLMLAASGAASLARGVWADGSVRVDWYQGYADPLNAVRVGKSLLWALLVVPLARRAVWADRARVARNLLAGMAVGLAIVAAAAVWERLAYAGLADLSAVYRVTALFWEMHVGGGAIDGYLALASPFAVLLLVRARGWAMRLLAVLLLVAVVYTSLATFSRGVYVGVLVPLTLLLLVAVVAAAWRRPEGGGAGTVARRSGPAVGLGAALLLASVMMVWLATSTGGFLANRMAYTENVWNERQEHWHDAVALLQSPADWWFGLGAGRFPAAYSEHVRNGAFAGRVVVVEGDGRAGPDPPHVTLVGPPPRQKKGGLFALTQRVDLVYHARYRVSVDVRTATPAVLMFRVCERHLLYPRRCQRAHLSVAPTPRSVSWRRHFLTMQGPVLVPTAWDPPRLGMFSIAVLTDGGAVDLANVHLEIGDGREKIANGDFSRGLARWFPAAQYYFVPWHPDSVYLDLLVERGLVAMIAVLGLVASAAWRCVRRPGPDRWFAWCLLAALLSALLVGVVSSFMDVPRVAFLLYLLSFLSIELGRSPVRMVSLGRTPQ